MVCCARLHNRYIDEGSVGVSSGAPTPSDEDLTDGGSLPCQAECVSPGNHSEDGDEIVIPGYSTLKTIPVDEMARKGPARPPMSVKGIAHNDQGSFFVVPVTAWF